MAQVNSPVIARRSLFRHPFSDDPEHQAPPCDRLFICNPPTETALDHFQTFLKSLRGYLRSKAFPAGQYIHYVVYFEDQDSATAALFSLYGAVFSEGHDAPLRCSFAWDNNSRPTDQHFSKPLADSDRSTPSDQSSSHPPSFRRQHVVPDRRAATRLKLRFANVSGAEQEMRLLILDHATNFDVTFPFSNQTNSVCYLQCVDTSESTRLRHLFEGYRLECSSQPVQAHCVDDLNPRSNHLPAAPVRILKVEFSPNDPSHQMDIKDLFKSQDGYDNIDFITPWTWSGLDHGICLVHFETVDDATKSFHEINGHALRAGRKSLKISYSSSAHADESGDTNESVPRPSKGLPAAQVSDIDAPDHAADLVHDDLGPERACDPIMTDPEPEQLHDEDKVVDEVIDDTSLWIANLSADATEAELLRLFWNQPGVIDVRYIKASYPKHAMCFVDFSDSSSAANAIQNLYDYPIKGQKIHPRYNKCPLSRKRKDSESTPLHQSQQQQHWGTFHGPSGPTSVPRPSPGCALLGTSLPRRVTPYLLHVFFCKQPGFEYVILAGGYHNKRALVVWRDPKSALHARCDLSGLFVDYRSHFGIRLRPVEFSEIDDFADDDPSQGSTLTSAMRAQPTGRPAPMVADLRQGKEQPFQFNTAKWSDSMSDDEQFSDYHSDEEDDTFSDVSKHVHAYTEAEALSIADMEVAPEANIRSDPDLEPVEQAYQAHDAESGPEGTVVRVGAISLDPATVVTTLHQGQAKDTSSQQGATGSARTQQLLSLFGVTQNAPTEQEPKDASIRSPSISSSAFMSPRMKTSALDDLKELDTFYEPEGQVLAVPAMEPEVETPKPRTTFFDLPREVRDIIYEEVFGTGLILMTEIRAFRRYLSESFPACASNANRIQGISPEVFPCLEKSELESVNPLEFGRRPAFPPQVFGQGLTSFNVPFKRKYSLRGISVSPTNASLLFTCRQLSLEFFENIQSRCIPAFSKQKDLVKHLRLQVSEKGKRRQFQQALSTRAVHHPAGDWLLQQVVFRRKNLLRSICLEIDKYGEPADLTFRPRRFKYYENWRQACAALVEQLPDLQHVALSVHVPASIEQQPSQLNLGAPWAMPILEFGRSGRLKTASVTLLVRYHTQGATLDTAQAFSEVLRRKMVGHSDEMALEAIAEYKTLPAQSQKAVEVQHKAWVLVERSNGLPPTGLLGGLVEEAELQQGELVKLMDV